MFEQVQLEALLAEANNVSQFWGKLFSTLALSGARVTEILTVKWKDVQANKLFLEPIKNPTRSARSVACPKLLELLRKWRDAQSRTRPVDQNGNPHNKAGSR